MKLLRGKIAWAGVEGGPRVSPALRVGLLLAGVHSEPGEAAGHRRGVEGSF